MKLEISNCAQRWMAVSTNEKKCKIRSKRSIVGSRDPLLDFCDPLNISGMNEARNITFVTVMDRCEY